jgi:hypothetical protein
VIHLIPPRTDLLDGREPRVSAAKPVPLDRLPRRDRQPGPDLAHQSGTGRRNVEIALMIPVCHSRRRVPLPLTHTYDRGGRKVACAECSNTIRSLPRARNTGG